MEVILRIVLMFIFVQFIVVMTIMSVALLVVRPEHPVFGGEPGCQTLRRSFDFVVHLPSRVRRSVVRLANFIPWRSVP